METQVAEFKFELDTKSCVEKKDDDSGVAFGYFKGYASTFGNLDLTRDVIESGAFQKSLAERNNQVKLYWQHDSWEPIGMAMELAEDHNGLRVEKGRINLGVARGRDAYALLKAGDLDSMSIGFRAKETDYDRDTDTRYIKEIDLHEISIVTTPANPKAMVMSVKCLDAISQAKSLDALEKILRGEGGFSRKSATALVSRVKELSKQSDSVSVGGQSDSDSKESQDLSELRKGLEDIINLYKERT